VFQSLSLTECAQKCLADSACTCFDYDHATTETESECRQLHGFVVLQESANGKDAYVRSK
jgi:hypothetical protein